MEVGSQPRKLLTPPAGSSAVSNTNSPFNSLDANVILALAIMLCGVICAVVVNAMVRCVLRVRHRVCYGPDRPGPIAPPCDARFPRKDALRLRALPTLVYSAGLGLGFAGTGSECAICLSEFAPGEHVRVLPRCNHGFHVACIDRWLAARSSCPTCRQGLEVCRTGPAQSVQMDPEGAMVQERGDL